MLPYLFHSQLAEHRSPTGAVTPKTEILFRVRVPREWQCCACRLLVNTDEHPIMRSDMFWAGMDGDHHEWWDCRFAPWQIGLYYYTFELDTADGTRVLRRQHDGSAGLSDNGLGAARWQITCYDENFKTPDWLAGGVMYQIFPDRFARSSQEKTDVPADRIMHDTWDEPVNWRTDDQGVFRCNDYYGGDL
ncbi:MAG: glycoside hydrolase family 13 protein, partial [Clostridia bacterium]|nr:glycoside hydrolase family 13 protein [Clostridia bacterium]